MPTNAVSYVLLHYFRNGTSLKNLTDGVVSLVNDIGRSHFFGFEQFQNPQQLVKHALEIMKGNLVEIDSNGA